jgi:type IV pilus assembly protein PilX
MNSHSLLCKRYERGVSLVVALLFMVIIAMLGIAISNVSVMEERMAGNTRSRDLAFQSAEAALRAAELRLPTDAAFRTAAEVYDAARGNDAAFWETCFAGTVAPCVNKYEPSETLPTTGTGAVAAQPRYVLELVSAGPPTEVYRVTARGVGGTADSIVVLQAEFEFTP